MVGIASQANDGHSTHRTYGGNKGGKDSGLHVVQRIDNENYDNNVSLFCGGGSRKLRKPLVPHGYPWIRCFKVDEVSFPGS
jgi:hypothetical protein